MEAIIKITAKLSRGNAFREVPIGSGDQAYVHPNGPDPTQPLKFVKVTQGSRVDPLFTSGSLVLSNRSRVGFRSQASYPIFRGEQFCGAI